jgi:2-dehydro-3-deoxygluconokinase
MTETRRIACIGEVMVELSDLAAPDGRATVGIAGDTFNTAIYLARTLAGSGWRVDYVTALGTDSLSERMLGAMAEEGIGSSLVARLPDRLPGLYAIELDPGGERRFLYWRSESAARAMFDAGAVPMSALAGFDVIYLSGITLAILPPEARSRLADVCAKRRAAGATVVFDSNFRPRLWPDAATARAAMEAMWRATTIGLPSRDDEEALWGAAPPAAVLDRLAGWGVGEVALKDGAAGPVLSGGAHEGRYPPAPKVVDTTAAGDSFNAGYLAARLTGADPVAAAEAAHALASRVIGHRGAILPRG